MNNAANECVSCGANCNACSGTDTITCTTCATYYAKVSGACVGCSSNCDACSAADTCTTCATGYMISSGACVACAANCDVCTTAGECTTCLADYTLMADNNDCEETLEWSDCATN